MGAVFAEPRRARRADARAARHASSCSTATPIPAIRSPAAAGLATLSLYEEEGLLTRAAGPFGEWARPSIAARHPHVIDIRTIGLIAGIELEPRPGAPGARAYDVFVDCFERGLLVRITGDIIALSPPLIIEREQIATMTTMLAEAIARAA